MGTMATAIFDLDGTLSDPAEGITKSLNHALVALGWAVRPPGELLKYIGPPLHVTFADLLGTSDEQTISSAIILYRQRYVSTGYAENHLYDGIREALASLRKDGCRLCVATSKRGDIAERALGHLGILELFRGIHGCDLDGSKSDLLRGIAREAAGEPLVMVGDRESDFTAAAEAGIPSIGVRWGYGNEDELARASIVVDRPDQLPQAIGAIARPADTHPPLPRHGKPRYRGRES